VLLLDMCLFCLKVRRLSLIDKSLFHTGLYFSFALPKEK